MGLRVGLTGGIGSGKTQVSNQLAAQGVDIIDTDVIAREIVTAGSPTLSKIVHHFGDEALTKTKQLDRAWLRKRIFENPDARTKLDEITHPVIAELTEQRLAKATGPYCVAVIPLLVNSAFKRLLDHVVVVVAPMEQRIDWIMNRNQLSRGDVLNMINSQISDKERIAHADTIIQNNGSLEDLKLATDKLHQDLLVIANQQLK